MTTNAHRDYYGPWTYDEDTGRVYDDAAHLILENMSDDDLTDEEAAANARLIAAAPDMLEALRATFAAYQGRLFSPARQAAWALMQAAIAKAEGRS